MVKQLQVNSTVLVVESVYPFRYDFGKGKQVLRVMVKEENHSFADLVLLKNCISNMDYLEDGALKITYTGYSLDFNCQYNEGVFSVEVTRQSEEAARIDLLETALNEFILG